MTEANLFGKSKKVREEMNQAKADFEKAMEFKEDSRQARAFKSKIGLRIRSSIDKIFIDGAEKFAKFAELRLAATAAGEEVPEPPKSSAFVKIKSVNGEIFSYLPEDKAEVVFQLGGRYQNVEIDAKTAIRRAQLIANQYTYELDLENSLVVLQFLREELEESGNPFTESDLNEDAEDVS